MNHNESNKNLKNQDDTSLPGREEEVIKNEDIKKEEDIKTILSKDADIKKATKVAHEFILFVLNPTRC
jgi:hypothetical protein